VKTRAGSSIAETAFVVVISLRCIAPISAWAGSFQEWPQFLGPHANGISDETGLLDKWPTNGPPMVWSKEIGTGYGAPSLRGGSLVVHHRLRDEEIVECLDAREGKSRWQYNYPSHFIDPYGYNNGPRSSPVLTAVTRWALKANYFAWIWRRAN
jgi:outer membrane protein assembly factor BamB